MAELERTSKNGAVSLKNVVDINTKAEVKILLAEDNLVNQKLANLLFRKLGFPINIVSTGREAVDEAMRNKYDIIFMDVHMPEMDGMEAARELKKSLGDSCPCIVALTADTMNGDRERMLRSGMDDYLAKPIDFTKLNQLIHQHAIS